MSRPTTIRIYRRITSTLAKDFEGLALQKRACTQRENFGASIFCTTIVNDSEKLSNIIVRRPFATKDGKSLSEEEKPVEVKSEEILDDPFGLNYEPGQHNIGPIPTKYKRDAVTNIFTGEIETDLTESQRRLLREDPTILENRLAELAWENWNSDDNNETMLEKYNKLGRSVRESEMSLNVLGRSVQSQTKIENLEDGTKFGIDEKNFSQQLTSKEFSNFTSYMDSQFATRVTREDLPVLESQSGGKSKAKYDKNLKKKVTLDNDIDPEDQDERELSLKWLTARGRRAWNDDLDENLYAELLPHQMNPARVVNRKLAKKIPPRLLHHNNVQLLQRFLTPTCQIQTRVQTRLGAKDQRSVAKLIRRARAIGLLPYNGQIKVERHGWVHSRDIDKLRDWEKQLIERGLIINRKNEDN